MPSEVFTLTADKTVQWSLVGAATHFAAINSVDAGSYVMASDDSIREQCTLSDPVDQSAIGQNAIFCMIHNWPCLPSW